MYPLCANSRPGEERLWNPDISFVMTGRGKISTNSGNAVAATFDTVTRNSESKRYSPFRPDVTTGASIQNLEPATGGSPRVRGVPLPALKWVVVEIGEPPISCHDDRGILSKNKP